MTIRQMKGEGRNVSAFVQLANWDGPEDMRPTQEIQLMIRNEIDGQPEAGAIGFSVDAATRKNQECELTSRFLLDSDSHLGLHVQYTDVYRGRQLDHLQIGDGRADTEGYSSATDGSAKGPFANAVAQHA